jgi:hypothetical protein
VTLKERFNQACEKDLVGVLQLASAQQLGNSVGALLTTGVSEHEIRDFVDECLRVGLMALRTARGDQSLDENAKALADALRPPLKIV